MAADKLTRAEFIALYTTQWLAAYAATNYTSACDSGDHGALTSEDVVDEARTYASAAWKSYEARRDVACHCQLEAGDSACPMHDEDSEPCASCAQLLGERDEARGLVRNLLRNASLVADEEIEADDAVGRWNGEG